MKITAKKLLSQILVIPLALFSLFAFGQSEIVSIEKLIKTQTLSGRVQLGDSTEGVKGVLVEECSSDWKFVKASTLTDENGHFQLPNGSRKGTHHLRLSLYGAHTLLVKVKITRSGDKELTLVLSFKT
jgi:hypothetical protein